MSGKTFAEKVLGAPAGAIVFRKPDLVLSHDNTASIEKIFRKMNGSQLFDAQRLVITLDHNAPPTSARLANDYLQIRRFARANGVTRFHDSGEGICHQLMARYARPGMLITGSDSHTCTAGAFNAFAAGIDRTETAGLWKAGETWFRVPETLKIVLTGQLPPDVYAKDLVLYIIGKIGADGADYLSVEFHGEGVRTLTIDDRMTIANMASEMGAKNAVFPADAVLQQFLGQENPGIWSDEDAVFKKEVYIDLGSLFPVISCPHQVDQVRAVEEAEGIPIGEALIGTCTNGRLSDLRTAASILSGHKVAEGVQLLVIPASSEIYLQAIREGIVETLTEAGASILSASCGPCLGTGQGIPADGINVISSANRNFPGRMGNPKASVYLASPATVAHSAITGKITSPSPRKGFVFQTVRKESSFTSIDRDDLRRFNGVWDYREVNNLNTDQMFAGNLTYEISSAEPDKIVPHLFKGFDDHFSGMAEMGDILLCGENFGCGSSREHPTVGLVHLGIRAIIVRSVARIFFRSAINQGLPIIVVPEAMEFYQRGDKISIFPSEGKIIIGEKILNFSPLPGKLLEILEKGGLVNAMQGGEIRNN
jgi:homoaconitate hydratase family protein/3-isopropylmalate dehydratase small subunit